MSTRINERLRIGEFARLGHVSVKALRFYEAEGLLKPAHVDPVTGYRYYRVRQTERLALITNLRAAGFSIGEIAALLDSDLSREALARFIAAQRQRLLGERAEIDEQLKIVDTLTQSLRGRSGRALSAVKLRSVPPRRVHATAATVPSLGESVSAIFESAEATVASHQARASEAPFLIFHDPPAQRVELRIEVCIPVTETAPGKLETTVIPGCELACSVAYGGAYEQTENLRERMIAWIDGAGLKPDGPLREVYHRFGADQQGYRLPAGVLADDSEDYLTELLLPIATIQ